MAVCVINPTMDSESGLILPACNVHCVYGQCPDNGKPASATPIETTDDTGRLAGLAFWARQTRQQRPLVMHHGSWLDEPWHEGRDCWCEPDFFPAQEVKS